MFSLIMYVLAKSYLMTDRPDCPEQHRSRPAEEEDYSFHPPAQFRHDPFPGSDAGACARDCSEYY